MKILKLTLKKKWFDMILSGEKKEEYREMKTYWNTRLSFLDISSGNPYLYERVFNKFTHIEFSNGYGSKVPKILIECKGIEINKGKQEWGAELNAEYFVINLGQIVSTSNLL